MREGACMMIDTAFFIDKGLGLGLSQYVYKPIFKTGAYGKGRRLIVSVPIRP